MRHGFSLVELSIVLVILGLLVGGVLAGKSLIHAAEVRVVSTEYNRYHTAVMAFRDKYFALPGDMANATNFWGIADGAGNDATCQAFESTTTATCNGNGSGRVGDVMNERLRFWQHLANAGLIDGRFTGALTTTATDANNQIAGTNAPASKYPRGTWATRSHQALSGDSQSFDGDYTPNHFVVGALTTGTTNNWPGLLSLLLPVDAWNIDKKIDDGMPGVGRILARSPNGWNNASGTINTCTLAQTSAEFTAGYALAVTSQQCTLYFMSRY